MKNTAVLITSLILAQGCSAIAADKSRTADPPMIINLAWSSPDTRYLRLNVEKWEKLPFTGTVVFASNNAPPGGNNNASTGENNATWQVFFKNRIAPSAVDAAIADLQATKFTRSKDNFLEVISWLRGRQHFDWYDDEWWAIVLHNIEQVARIAKQGGCRGILLDMEEYGCPFWSWGGTRPHFALKSKDTYKDKTWEATEQLCYERGIEFLQALNKGFPNCPIWTLYAYSHIELKDDMSEAGNGLYAAFFDGWLEGSDAGTYFIDGCEGSYRFDHTNPFVKLREVVTDTALKYTRDPDLYQAKVRVGFGLYMDMYNYANSHPWYPDRPEDNYMTPQHLEKAVRCALKIGDGYVWIYNEHPSWWLDSPAATFGEGSVNRPDHSWIDPVYARAIERALQYRTLEAEITGPENIARGKPVDGKDGSSLTDGDIDSRTPQAGFSFAHTVDLQGVHNVSRVTLYWGIFGKSPDSIQQWELSAELADGSTVTVASGACPQATETTVAVDRENVTKLRVKCKSEKNWIAMSELAAYAPE